MNRLRRRALRTVPESRSGLCLEQGIGDDCAIFSGSRDADILVTTDLFLEGIHFRRSWQPAASAGHKVLARGLSDIAAMGGTPRFAFLSLALPRRTQQKWVDDFFRGLFRLADRCGVVLAGGDTSASDAGILADIMVIGEVPRGRAVLRSGARPGDTVWVAGQLGGAARALEWLRQGRRVSQGSAGARRFFAPEPRLETGRVLRERGIATAMMDVSDGLSLDLDRLCKASGVGARIEEEKIPRARGTPLAMALHGGEDFELLFTVPARLSRRVPAHLGGVPLTCIGEITKERRLRIVRGGKPSPLPLLGFQHF